jgi:hypothetical protein
MNHKEMMTELSDEGAMVPDGYDDCIIGIGRRSAMSAIAIMDSNAIIEKLAKDMTMEEAQEFFEFNIIGSHIENGPIYAEMVED